MPTTYLPRPDGDFNAFADHYNNQAVHKFWEAQGLDANDFKPLEEAAAAWKAAFPAHVAAQARAEGARAAKDEARGGLERAIRPIANFIQIYPKTTDADRAAIGITRQAAHGRNVSRSHQPPAGAGGRDACHRSGCSTPRFLPMRRRGMRANVRAWIHG